jgi:hypothetical protein
MAHHKCIYALLFITVYQLLKPILLALMGGVTALFGCESVGHSCGYLTGGGLRREKKEPTRMAHHKCIYALLFLPKHLRISAFKTHSISPYGRSNSTLRL